MHKMQGGKLNPGLLLKPNIQFSEQGQKTEAGTSSKKLPADSMTFQKCFKKKQLCRQRKQGIDVAAQNP